MKKLNTILKSTALATLFATVLNTAYAQPTELLTAGGFEAGSAAWTQSSTNFGTPLCDAGCGLGGGTGPNSGAFWAWFGGIAGALEQGEVSQSVVIPTGLVSANLSFYLEVPVCDAVGGAQDYLVVLMDTDTIYSVTGNDVLCGTLSYGQLTFNALAYADGNAHTLTFTSTTFGTGGETNFFVDDVSLLADNGTVGVDCGDTLTFLPALVITDGDTLGVSDVQTISGLTGTLGSTISLESVCLNVTHTWVGDVRFILTAPNGTSITLLDRPGFPASIFGCDGDDFDFCIEGGTGNDAENVCGNLPAISGNYTAANANNLNDINTAGGSPNGTWTLSAADFATPDPGTINSWTLTFSTGPVAAWTPPASVCATSGTINLNTLITGTTGGTWAGTGVTGNTFDPTGLASATITYTVTDIAGCTDSQTSTIAVAAGVPTAGFTYVAVASTVTFTNSSTNGGTYSWDFGDGGSATDTNTVHTYPAPGTYTVTLTATNVCGTNSTTQIITLGCADVVADGSFEGGPGAGTWIESSTNFGTPLCDALGCGVGTGTGPNTGLIWAWFGGLGGALEQGSLIQSVIIPANATSADLTFFTEYPVCDSVGGSQDFIVLTLGVDTIYQTTGIDSACGTVGYVQRSFNVLSSASGIPQDLAFNSTTFGTGGVTNFFVDDVSLVVCSPVGIQELVSGASVSLQPNPASTYFDISLKNVKENVNVIVKDMTGKSVYNKTIEAGKNAERVNVSKWSKGLYVVNFTVFGKNYSQKIVIE